MIYLLDDTLAFPDPRDGEPDGLFAVGGDLGTERLLLAYSIQLRHISVVLVPRQRTASLVLSDGEVRDLS